jgi:hypothetical protein
MDNNCINSLDDFPKILTLGKFVYYNQETLSLNKNNIVSISNFLDNFAMKYPNTLHLSLLFNPCNPVLNID